MIFELIAFAVILLYISVGLQQSKWMKPFIFLGVNSMVIFGVHDMYLTVIRMITQNTLGEMNVWLGFLNMVIVLLMMIPTIFAINKYIPFVAGRKTATTG